VLLQVERLAGLLAGLLAERLAARLADFWADAVVFARHLCAARSCSSMWSLWRPMRSSSSERQDFYAAFSLPL
jgi:hypothetical protein